MQVTISVIGRFWAFCPWTFYCSDALEKCGFLKEIFWVKFAMPAWEYFKKYPDKEIILRQKGSILFDLYSKGLIIWAKKI